MTGENLTGHLDFGNPDQYEKLDLTAPDLRGGQLCVGKSDLRELSERAFSDIAFRYPCGHLEKLAALAGDRAASEGERFVARELLRNAAIAARGIHPMCQDTGTALVYGWRGDRFASIGPGSESLALSSGAAAAWTCGWMAGGKGAGADA